MSHRIPGHLVLVDDGSFVAPRLAEQLNRQYKKIHVLSLAADRWLGPGEVIPWDGLTLSDRWISALEGADALLNLIGGELPLRRKEIDCEYLARHHRTVIDTLGRGLRLVYRVPKAWVQASSLSIYGETGDRICDESGWVPDGALSEVSLATEEALGQAIRPEMRWVILRTGLVLAENAGALALLERRMRTVGHLPVVMEDESKKWVSWIHLEDLVHLWRAAIGDERLAGIFHATGLQPVTTAEFAGVLAETMNLPGRPAGEIFDDLALPGGRCLPRHFHRRGIHFGHHDLDETLAKLVAGDASSVRGPRPTAVLAHLTA
jgi:uncharacterized protein